MSGSIDSLATGLAFQFKFLFEKSEQRLNSIDYIFPALNHGNNGRRLALIINSRDPDPDLKIAKILDLLVQDQTEQDSKKSRLGKLFSPVGGFRKDSFKVEFIGTLIGANFAGCKTEAAFKAAIVAQLTHINQTSDHRLYAAVQSFRNTTAGQNFMGLATAMTPVLTTPQTAGVFQHFDPKLLSLGDYAAPAA